jgi:hypothetical protein
MEKSVLECGLVCHAHLQVKGSSIQEKWRIFMTNLPFERKSKVNTNSDNYLDANGNYVYTRMVHRPNGQWEREVIDVVPLTAENMECIIVLEENDHDVDI